MSLRNAFFAGAGLVFASVFLFSCSNQIDSHNGDEDSGIYGSVCLRSTELISKKLEVSSIFYADVYVTGDGITEEIAKKKVSVKNGINAGEIVIEKIPVGKNRIVSVQAYDAKYKAYGSYVIRNICDINAGERSSVYVSWQTTALSNVFNSLYLKGQNLNVINESSIEEIKNLISSIEVSHPVLIDTEAIAEDFIAASFGQPSSYVLQTSKLNLTTNIENYTLQVCDPLSNSAVFSSSSAELSGIAPGNWRVNLYQDEKIVKSALVNFISGQTSEINLNVISDSILLHVYGYSHIWAWNNDNVSENYTGGVWPGIKMDEDSYMGSGWYAYELPVTESMIIFSNNGSGQTSDMSQTSGEWWYKGEWFSEDPSDYSAPVILDFSSDKSGLVSDEVIFTVNVSDDKKLKKAELYKDGTKLAVISLNGKTCREYYTWDSGTCKNGTYEFTVKVYDDSGNCSESQSIVLTTNNENRPPVAVITGYSSVGLGKTVLYKATSSYDPNGEIASYNWTVSGGAQLLSGQGTCSVSVKFPDFLCQCSISLTVTDDDGASASENKIVNVQENTSFDFREETIYFAMTTRFYDGDPSNNVHCWDENAETPANDPAWRGDFKGFIQKLDYIKALGFSAVWITPVVENCSGLDYHGYHAMNFQKVDPRYESSDVDFQTLIDEVHARDMKLVLDVVFNHTGNFGEANLAPMFEKDYSANLEDIDSCLKLSANSILDESYFNLDGDSQYATRLKLMKNTDWNNHEKHNYYHHFGFGSWDDFSVQFFQMAGDCVDLNTENPKVLKYIVDSYSKYIEMGVDAFRIDTGKHMSRLEFNCYLNDAFKEAASRCGNDNFFMFTEICAKSSEVTYRGSVENLSPYFYTWKDDETYGFTMADEDMYEGVIILPETNDCPNDQKDEQRVTKDLTYWTRETEDGRTVTPVNSLAVQKQGMATHSVRSNRPTSNNHLLNGNTYHTPDYSNASGLNVIDFPMHWNFNSASGAFGVHGDDKLYNDATWNVVYVDSHDYGPSAKYEYRYDGGTDAWAENLDLMFTFRGIPCLYYGSEIEFQAGMPIDKGPVLALKDSGRAYYGDYLEGNVVASDFGEYSESGTTGAVKTTLEKPLCQHIMRLNKIRRAIPALQKGQYSTENCGSGGMAFKRRYTDSNTDSFVLVTISSDTTFTGLPGGTYVDAITGDTKHVSEGGSITTSGCTKGNMRIYVLDGPGKIGEDTDWLK